MCWPSMFNPCCGVQIGKIINGQTSNACYLTRLYVDTENKTTKNLQNCLNLNKLSFSQLSGRGNNWSCGFNCNKSVDDLILQINGFLEVDCSIDGILVLHSIGTGSGLGSRLVQELRNNYPKNISPFITGETTLQHYNTVLTLGWMQKYSDSIILFQNEKIFNKLSKRNKFNKPNQIDLQNINLHIKSSIENLFKPIFNDVKNLEYFDGFDYLINLNPISELKFNEAESLELDEFDRWEDITSQLISTLNLKSKVYGAQLITRTNTFESQFQFQKTLNFKKLREHLKPVYEPENSLMLLYSLNQEKTDHNSLTLVKNSNEIINYLEEVNRKGNLIFKSKAFLHWYQKYGEIESDLEDSFEVLESVIENYKFY
ncbi:hypothetical protein HK099_004074 [Clydaea vesicula]|uniref:Tubulin delta chain n=1 Tax=Clydaea vesicula TaxID=447962 RepID=A0AAD5U6Y8_9FUNG|nr:hypothetical protein HK099_004074 [Clydaea vesicula]